jgi:hypothetical protein
VYIAEVTRNSAMASVENHQAALALSLISHGCCIRAVDTKVVVIGSPTEETHAGAVTGTNIHSPRHQRHQIPPIATIDWETADLFVLHRSAKLGRVAGQVGLGHHLHRYLRACHLEDEVERSGLTYAEFCIRTDLPESIFFCLDGDRAKRQRCQRERTGSIRQNGSHESGLDVANRDLRV